MNTNKNLDNSFEGLDIFGRDKVQIYVYLHINAMVAKQSDLPFLAPLVVSTQTIYNNMFLNISGKTSDIMQRIVQTKAVSKSLKDFKTGARAVQSRTVDKLGQDSPIYTEMFANGLKFL